MATTIAAPVPLTLRFASRPRYLTALLTLARRRASLTAHNPRQIAVPLLTPILFATVIAPALKAALGGLRSLDYTAFRLGRDGGSARAAGRDVRGPERDRRSRQRRAA
jgi:hypothetical protein